MPDAPLLRVDGLVTEFRTGAGVVRAVDGVSFEVRPGETVGLVGESGCGKSALALSILRLLPVPQGRISSGKILWKGNDLLGFSPSAIRSVRGKEIAIIFQEPMTSLNPVFTVGSQIEEAIRAHEKVGHREAWARAVELLARVGIADPAARARDYPHQLSGGMRQRVLIAMALSCRPSLLIADEPTTALDVTVQAGILELLLRLQQETGMAVLLITHDMGVVAETARRVLVMYAGQIVEEAPVGGLFERPLHPYTTALLDSIPRVTGRRERLRSIPGSVPDPGDYPVGCRFHPRCPIAEPACRAAVPALETKAEARAARCIKVEVSAA